MVGVQALVQALGLEDALEVADGVVEPDVLAVPAVDGRPGSAADLGPGQKAAANREVSAAMRQRLAAGKTVARMYREPGWSAKPRWPRNWSLGGSQRENRPGS